MPHHDGLQVSDMMNNLFMSRLQMNSCDFCKCSLRGISAAGLVVEYDNKKFCSDTCVESWVDERDAENNPQ